MGSFSEVHRRLAHQHRRRHGAARAEVGADHPASATSTWAASSASSWRARASTSRGVDDRPRAADRAGDPRHPRRATQFPLIFYRENCADMALCEDDIDPAFIAEARAVRGHRHASQPPAHRGRRAEGAAPRARARRAHRARHRLPPEPLGRSPATATGESRFVESAAVTAKLQAHAAPLRPDRRHRGGVPHRRRHDRHHRRAARGARASRTRRWSASAAPMGAVGLRAARSPTASTTARPARASRSRSSTCSAPATASCRACSRAGSTDEDWPTALKYANACGAFAVSRHGCTPAYPVAGTSCEFFLERGVEHAPPCATTRSSSRSTGRPTGTATWPTMRVFAFDHRMQLEEMEGATPEKIGAFKQLCLEAALAGRGRPARLRHPLRRPARPRRAATRPPGTGLWIGRPVEWPGSRPLTLEPELGPDFGGLSRMAARERGQGALLLPSRRRRPRCGPSRRRR